MSISVSSKEIAISPEISTWHELHAAKFAFASPFNLQLADNEIFVAEKILRIIPKRRIVAFGVWKNKPVVAKLFFDPHHAKRHAEKDALGAKILKEYKIPTPTLYYQGMSADKRIHVLLYEKICHAESLEVVWQNRKSLAAVLPQVKAVIVELATQHVLGVQQHDLHCKNFLLAENHIYTLDGAQVELVGKLLPKKPSMQHLALFLSQFGIGVEHFQELLFRYYAKSRGWLLKQEDVHDLFLSIKNWNDLRWKRFERKIMRECTDFVRVEDWRTFGMYDRQFATPEFQQFLKNPESIFQHPEAQILKAGHSTTVIRIKLDDKDLVVKRYNIKNSWHRLRRCLRSTRALSSWRLAQKLRLFGIHTAKPVAFLENNCMGFRGKSYFVTEYVSGQHLGDYFNRYRHQENDQVKDMVERVTELLKNLAKLEITHGDLKITNILINAANEPVLIDLDGASEHDSLSGLKSAWRKEIKRFLRNFTSQPTLLDSFKQALR